MSKLFYAVFLFVVIGFFTYASAAEPENIALKKPAVASSVEKDDLTADKAFDGDVNTRWSSAFSDDQWIYVDLQKQYTITGIQLIWEWACGKDYKIQVSNDAKTWTDVYATEKGKGQTEDIAIDSKPARYVKLLGIKRGTEFGYSLFEFKVFGK